MATQRLATFAPNDVSVIITQTSTGIAHIISGYSEDSIVNIEWTSPRYTLYTGADNTGTRVFNASNSASLTLSLQQTSASNDVLSSLFNNDPRNIDGLFSVQVKDASGRSIYFSDDAYIGVRPNAGFSNSMMTRDWVIQAFNLDGYAGGNAVVTPEDQATLETLGATLAAKWLQQ
jgi:hypothetical protein